MSDIYLLNYENYFNRRCPKPSLLATDYEDYELDLFRDINFHPNDGINTELIINYNGTTPNYLLEVAPWPQILTRWYVMEAQRTRIGQLRLILRRDLIADFYNDIIAAPAMIERGQLKPTDSYIFNDEGIRFNQIKHSETLLKDETESAWIVGYMALPQDESDSLVVNSTYRDSTEIQPDYTVASLGSWGYTQYVGSSQASNCRIHVPSQDKFSIYANSFAGPAKMYTYSRNTNTTTSVVKTLTQNATYTARNPEAEQLAKMSRAFAENTELSFSNFVPDQEDLRDELRSLDGKILRVGEKFYTIRCKAVLLSPMEITPGSIVSGSTAYTAFVNLLANNPDLFSGSASNLSFSGSFQANGYYLELEDLTSSIKLTIPKSVVSLVDAPYRMFAIPYHLIRCAGLGGTTQLSSKNYATQTAAAIREQLGDNVYDIQLLPYFPLRRVIGEGGVIDFVKLVENIDYTLVKDQNDEVLTALFWCDNSTFSFNINDEYYAEDLKVVSQCYTYRLCSPNYASIFEFNLAKNGGINYFNVDCSYKPYSPYIHVNPDWKKLYGQDFNDPRGLVCSGDFSMTATQDQWQRYQIDNKNYQNMFNREIESMDTKRGAERQAQIASIVAGAVSGTVSGAMAGAMTGGVYGHMGIGGAIGGAIGAAGSIGTGIADYNLSEAMYKEDRSKTIDMFRMSNENVQARPDTLTKVSAFDANNKLFPVFEIYRPTGEELVAFNNYIKYKGMKVGRIDEIRNFIWKDEYFVQASIIRFPPTIGEDAHIAYEINSELMKGVYMKQ